MAGGGVSDGQNGKNEVTALVRGKADLVELRR